MKPCVHACPLCLSDSMIQRVIDNIPSMIDLKSVKAIANRLRPFLIASFQLAPQSTSRRCAEYLEEDKAIVSRKTELQAAEAGLEEVEKELFKFSLQSIVQSNLVASGRIYCRFQDEARTMCGSAASSGGTVTILSGIWIIGTSELGTQFSSLKSVMKGCLMIDYLDSYA